MTARRPSAHGTRWRQGDPTNQPLRTGDGAKCVICGEANDPDRPNSPYCAEDRLQKRREAKARWREKRRERTNAISHARRLDGVEHVPGGIYLTAAKRSRLLRRVNALLIEVARVSPTTPVSMGQQHWAAYADRLHSLATAARAEMASLDVRGADGPESRVTG